MQVLDNADIEKRILFYWSKMYSKSIKSGEHYDVLGRNIIILISDYELDSLKKIPKYITKWNIREEEFSTIILTNVLEIYIIELVKFDRYDKSTKNKLLRDWIKFIKNSEVIDMDNSSKAIKQAKKVLEEISQDEHEIYLAELREKYIRDQKSVEKSGYTKGIKEGIKEGIKQGIKDGKNAEKVSIAKELKRQNVDAYIISNATGLSIEKIKEL